MQSYRIFSYLIDATTDGPNVAGPSVALAPKNLGSHEGYGALDLTLEFSGHGGRAGGGQAGGCPEVGDPQVVAG